MALFSRASNSTRPSLSKNGFSTIAWGGGTPAKKAAKLGLFPPQEDLILVTGVIWNKKKKTLFHWIQRNSTSFEFMRNIAVCQTLFFCFISGEQKKKKRKQSRLHVIPWPISKNDYLISRGNTMASILISIFSFFRYIPCVMRAYAYWVDILRNPICKGMFIQYTLNKYQCLETLRFPQP